MSNVAALNFKAELADAEALAAKRKAEMEDASASTILSLRRELKSAPTSVGVVYFYDPPSVMEREASQKHMRFDGKGLSISMLGIVDGILARVRTKDARPMFRDSDRARLLELPADSILDIWHAIGGESGKLDQAVDAAEKK